MNIHVDILRPVYSTSRAPVGDAGQYSWTETEQGTQAQVWRGVCGRATPTSAATPTTTPRPLKWADMPKWLTDGGRKSTTLHRNRKSCMIKIIPHVHARLDLAAGFVPLLARGAARKGCHEDGRDAISCTR